MFHPVFSLGMMLLLLALEYAEVEYDKIWIKEILTDKLKDYDWLHLHHEDFTGQFGKFYSSYRGARWYQEHQILIRK